jgi:hypothetical protein
VLRRLLASGAAEAVLAQAAGLLTPRLAARLAGAAQQGDLPALLDAAGWPVRSPAELDRALAAELIRQDRRRQRLVLAVRLLLPILIALPVGLSSAAVALSIMHITRSQVVTAAGDPRGSHALHGGSMGAAVVFWWVARCEAQGEAAVEQAREQARPVRAIVIPQRSTR